MYQKRRFTEKIESLNLTVSELTTLLKLKLSFPSFAKTDLFAAVTQSTINCCSSSI